MRIDHTDSDNVLRVTSKVAIVLCGLRDNLTRGAARYNRVSPHELDAMSVSTESSDGTLDVRLVSNSDGELWFATGDVGYDTVHGTACGACTLSGDETDEDCKNMATDLVDQVVDQLSENESEGL